MERTFVMIKPDGVQRSLTGTIITRLEQKGLKVVALKMLQIPQELAKRHYGEHEGKLFFKDLVEYITSGPVVAMVLEGKDAISTARNMMGTTNPQQAAPGTIRGDYAMDIGRNVIHGSDSPTSAQREIALFFTPEEMTDYQKCSDVWIYE